MKEKRRIRTWIKVVKKAQRIFSSGRHSKMSVVLPLGKHVLLSALSQKRAAEGEERLVEKGLKGSGWRWNQHTGRKIILEKVKGRMFPLIRETKEREVENYIS